MSDQKSSGEARRFEKRARKRTSRGTARHRKVAWRPTPELVEKLDTWTAGEGYKSRGEAISAAVGETVARHQMGTGLEGSVVADVFGMMAALGEVVTSLGRQAQRVERTLGGVGPAYLAVPHILAGQAAEDPRNREAGESRDDAAFRIHTGITDWGYEEWAAFREGTAPVERPPVAPSGPTTDPETLAVRLIEQWRSSRRGREDVAAETATGGGAAEWTIDRWRRRRIERWARARGCEGRTAARGLIDFALGILDGRGEIPRWALHDVVDAVRRADREVSRCRDLLEALEARVDLIGAVALGVPEILIHWCVQDPIVRLELAQACGAAMADDEIEEHLRATFWAEGERSWTGWLRGQGLLQDEGDEDLDGVCGEPLRREGR